MENVQNEIRFKNINQKILFDLVLIDEIQQGYWENSKPEGHSAPFEFVETKVDSENPGINFKPLRKYNFAATPILKERQTDMLWYVKLFNAFGYDNRMIDYVWMGFGNCVEPDRTGTKFTPLPKDHYVKLAEEVKIADNAIDFAYFLNEVWYGMPYTKKMLKEDLAEIKLIINGPVVKKQPKQNIPKEEPVEIKIIEDVIPEVLKNETKVVNKVVNEVPTIEKPDFDDESLNIMLVYLDDLRDSGATNMYGSASYVAEEFDLTLKQATSVVAYWMETYSERHTPEVRDYNEILDEMINRNAA